MAPALYRYSMLLAIATPEMLVETQALKLSLNRGERLQLLRSRTHIIFYPWEQEQTLCSCWGCVLAIES